MPWIPSGATIETADGDEKRIVVIHAALLATGERGEILYYGGPGWGA